MNQQQQRKATTFRLEPEVQEGLLLLGGMLKVPLNRLVNEAVRSYVRKRSVEIQEDLEQTLRLLKAHRAEDPDFESAISEFAAGEARYAKDDTAEGKGWSVLRGPVQSRVHDLLNP